MTTGWDIFLVFVAIAVFSFIAGAVNTWWEERKWNKKRDEVMK